MAARITSIPTHSYLYPYVPGMLDEAKAQIRAAIERKHNIAKQRLPVAIDEWAEQRFYIPSTQEPIQLLPHQRGILKLGFTRRANGFFPYRTVIYSTVKQSGKCLRDSSRVLMADGTEREAASIQVGDYVLTGSKTPARIIAIERQPPEPTYEITTDRGRVLITTGAHPYLVRGTKRPPSLQKVYKEDMGDRWVRANKLELGDRVVVALDWDGIGESWITPALAYVLGVWMGDGTDGRISNSDASIRARCRVVFPKRCSENDTDFTLGGGFCAVLRQLGLYGERSYSKRVPADLLRAGRECYAAFLSGYWDTDGTFGKPSSKANASLSSVSHELLKDVQLMHARLGINAKLDHKNGRYNGAVHESWRLTVDGQSQLRDLNAVLNLAKENKRARLAAIAAIDRRRPRSSFGTDRIISIRQLPAERTIALELDGDRTHITEGLITHNTTISGLILRWFAETQGYYQELYAIGNDLDQAMGRGFREARHSLELTPGYNKARDILPGEWECQAKTLKCLRTGSFIRALAVDATGEAGGKPAIQVWTELWGAESKEAIRFWEELTPVPTIPDSMRVIETYAGYEGESVLLKGLYDVGKSGHQLTAGEFTKRTGAPLGAFAEAPEPGDKIPIWENENAGMLMYWDSGVEARRMPWQQGERGAEYYRQQELDLTSPAAFDRFHKNLWSSAESQFIQEVTWDACLDEELKSTPLLPGDTTPIVLGVDAASTFDCFAIVAVSRHPKYHDQIAVRAVKVLDPKESGGRVDYDEAERFIRRICGGHCTAVQQHPASLPDPDCPDCQSKSLVPGNNVVHIAYDPYQLESMMQRLVREQVAWCKPFNQQGDRLKADRALYDAILTRRLWHNGDPKLRQHILNAGAKLQKDADSTLRLVKVAPHRKIDAAVALAMASARCLWLTL